MNAEEPMLLILETSGRIGQVALARGSRVCGVRRLDEARRHARDLAPAVASLLDEQGASPRHVQAVIVSRGPGSYTGLRVGIMSAKTFAYATGCALLAVDTFAAIALRAPPSANRLDVIADAQQDKVYVQRYVRTVTEGDWQPESLLRIQNFADWTAQREEDVWVTGPGLAVYGSRVSAGALLVSGDRWDPQPESLLRIGLRRFQAGERDDFWSVEPLYLRPSAAEEKWQTRQTS
jgi:tRNA threonylcarbamoyladenosine biosynthesis protein TsaB